MSWRIQGNKEYEVEFNSRIGTFYAGKNIYSIQKMKKMILNVFGFSLLGLPDFI